MNRLKQHVTWAALAALMAAGVVVFGAPVAAAGTASISGVVRSDADGQVLEGAVVVASGPDYQQVETAADGSYSLPDLTAGSYDLQFFGAGHLPEWYDDAASYEGRTPITLTDGESRVGTDASLSEGVVIEGVVTGADTFAAVADVEVFAERTDFDDFGSSTTAADGSFRVSGLSGGEYRIRVVPAPPYREEWYDNATTAETATTVNAPGPGPVAGIDVVLDLGGTISGTVTDADTGLPVPGIAVSTFGPDSAESTTAADGTYTLAGLVDGDYSVRFTPVSTYLQEWYDGDLTGGAPTQVTIADAAAVTSVDADLETGAGVSGTVVDGGTGLPIEGVEVQLSGPNYRAATTAADGSFEVSGVAAGSYQLWLNDPSRRYFSEYYDDVASWFDATELDLQLGTISPLELDMARGASIGGVVTDSVGAPIESGYVEVSSATSSRSASIASDGTYRVGPLVPGDYRVEFVPGGRTHLREFYDDVPTADLATQVTVVGSTDVTGIDASVGTTGSIAGIVTDDVSGLGIAGVQVSASSFDWSIYGVTRADGSYVLSDVPPGDYQVYFGPTTNHVSEYWDDAPDYTSAGFLTVGRGTDVTGIDAGLAGGSSITGTLTGPTGAPAANASVNVYDAVSGSYVGGAQADASGDYAVSRLPVGDFHLNFQPNDQDSAAEWFDDAPDRASATAVSIGAPGAVVVDIDAQFTLAAKISGTLTSSVGGPFVDGYVQVYDATALSYIGFSSIALDGSYEVGGLAAGSYLVQISSYSGTSEWYDDVPSSDLATPIALVAGEQRTGVDAEIQGPVSISGTVTDASTGLPVPNIYVAADDPMLFGFGSAYTAVDGTYSIANVSPGSYRVSFTDNAGSYAQQFFDGATSYDDATFVTMSDASVIGVDAALVAAGMISGIVLDDGGLPVVDAYVEAFDATTGSWVAAVGVDPSGGYTIGGLPAGDYNVSARAYRFRDQWYLDATSEADATPVTVTGGADTTGVDFALVTAVAISGTITDEDAGAPIPNIRVRASGGTTTRYAYTESDGTYAITDVDADDYVVQFYDDGRNYVTEYYDDVGDEAVATPIAYDGSTPATGIDATLTVGATLSGTVVDETGAPVPGVSVDVLDPVNGGWFAGASTDVVGAFSLSGLPPSDVVLGLSGAGWAPQWYDSATSFEDATPIDLTTISDVAVTMAERSSISGTVLESAGSTPVAEVTVIVQSDDAFVSTRTGADGSYAVRGLPPGSYRVQFAPGPDLVGQYFDGVRAWNDATLVELGVDEAQTGVDATLASAGSIAGVLLDAAGDPLPNVQVNAESVTLGITGAVTFSAADGTFLLPGLAGDDYVLLAYLPGGVRQYYDGALQYADATSVTVQPAENVVGVVFQLVEGGEISGNLVDENGTPVANAQLAVMGLGSTSWWYGSSNATGAFAIRGLPAGSYVLSVRADGYLTQWYDGVVDQSAATTITLEPSEVLSDLAVVLLDRASVSGVVTDETTGLPLADIAIQVWGDGYRWYTSTRTGADGTWQIRGLPTGSYVVRFGDSSDGYVEEYFDDAVNFADRTLVELVEGVSTTGIDAALLVEGVLSGVVRDEAGQPIANAWVEAVDASGTGPSLGDQTSADGSFSIRSLPAGDYVLRTTPPSGVAQYHDGAADAVSADVFTLTTGDAISGIEITYLTLGSIAGTVTDEATGLPLAGVYVELNNGVTNGSANSAADGSYELIGLPDGEYTVGFWDSGGDHLFEYYDGARTAAAATTLTITASSALSGIDASLIEEATISGTVVDVFGAPVETFARLYHADTDTYLQTAWTDVEGAYRFADVWPGNYRVAVFANDFVPQHFDHVVDPADATVLAPVAGEDVIGIDFDLVPYGSVAGAVVDASGAPFSSVQVSLLDGDTVVQNRYTDGSGAYLFSEVVPGAYSVRFTPSGSTHLTEWYDDAHAPTDPNLRLVVVGPGDDVAGIDAQLDIGSLAGTVVDASGRPLGGVDVMIDQLGRSTTTDPTGAYAFEQVPPGAYTLSAGGDIVFARTYYPDTVDAADATPVTLAPNDELVGFDIVAARQPAQLMGVVLDDAGRPMPGIRVTATNDPTSLPPVVAYRGTPQCCTVSMFTDLNGRFWFNGLDADDYAIRFEDANQRWLTEHWQDQRDVADATLVPVGVDPGVNELEATLDAAGTITGTVTNEEGQPVQSVYVTAETADEQIVYSDWTDADGGYELWGLGTSDYIVSFRSTAQYLGQFYDGVPIRADATPVGVVAGAETSGIDATMLRRGAISGTVTGPGGVPAPNVRVYADGVADRTATTDANGEYFISNLEADSYTIRFTSLDNRYISEYYDDVQDPADAALVAAEIGTVTEGIDAELAPYGSITGTVTDGVGVPIEGVRARVWVGGSIRTTALTRADGTFEALGLTTGSYQVQFDDPGGVFLPQWSGGGDTQGGSPFIGVSLGVETAGIDASLVRGGEIAGRVVDALGAPVTNANVSIAGVGSFSTGASSSFLRTGIAPGAYTVTVSKLGYESTVVADVTVDGDRVVLGDITLLRYGALAGTITDADGVPLAGMRVERWTGFAGSRVGSATTSAEGAYQFSGVPPGDWTIRAFDTNGNYVGAWYGDVRIREVSTLATTTYDVTTVADISLDAAGSITGTVTDEDGVPLQSVTVRIESNDLTVDSTATTTASGEYAVNGLHTDTYVVTFIRSGYVTEFYDNQTSKSGSEFVAVDAGTTTGGIDASLAAIPPVGTGSMSGRVVDESGTPLSDVVVTIRYTKDGAVRYYDTRFTDTAGTWSLTGLPPSYYYVEYSSDGHQDEAYDDLVGAGEPTPILVDIGADVSGIDAELGNGGSLAGTVTESGGAPVEGIMVSISGAQYGSTVTANDGTYSFAGLEPGPYQIWISDPQQRFFPEYFDDADSPSGATQVVLVSSGSVTADAVLDRPTASVGGTVVDGSGAPVASALVKLMTSANSWTATRYTAADGTFQFVGLSTGTYWVRVEGVGDLAMQWYGDAVLFDDAQAIDAVEGSPVTGVNVTLPERATIRGSVVNEAGAPLSSFLLRFYSPDEGFRSLGSTQTNEIGDFSFRPSTLADVIVLAGPGGLFLSEYYQDTEDPNAATRLSLAPGATVGNIDIVVSDNHPPQATLSADVTVGYAPLDVSFDLQVSDTDGDDVSYELSFGDGTTASGSDPGGVVDHTFVVPGTYRVRLEATDAMRGTVAYQTVTVVEPQPVVADAGGNQLGVAGSAVQFFGTGSTPADLIDSYQWDFGDGGTGSGASVTHVYTDAGEYEVTLTTVALGVASIDTATVTVLPVGTGTGISINVRATNGAGIAGAVVAVELPAGQTARTLTNAGGFAQVGVPEDGTYSVAVAQTGYLPRIVDVVVTNGAGQRTVTLEPGQLADAEVAWGPATLAEIIAAGVDVNDPDNQNVQAFDIEIVGYRYRLFYNFNGWLGYGGSGSSGGGGSLPNCVGGTCRIGFGGSGRFSGGISLSISADRETITVMTIPVEASWLKEFFNVELAVFSNTSPGFNFRGGTATLALPDGLSLADTALPQSLTVEFPDVPGGGVARHTWLVRGDEAGEYPISATYRGTLEPTGLPIGPLTVSSNTPLKVWGLEAIDFLIEADNRIDFLSPYHLRVGMKNVSNVPVYNARIAYGESDGTDYWYQPEEQLVYATETIAPGGTFWTDEIIVVDNGVTGPLYEGIVDVKISGLQPNEYEVTELAPIEPETLTAISLEKEVLLEWEPVSGAVGYRVYELDPDGSSFGDPVLVVGPEVTTAVLPDPVPDQGLLREERSIYAVSTTLGERVVLRHNAVLSGATNIPPRWVAPTPSDRTRFDQSKPGDSEGFVMQAEDSAGDPIAIDVEIRNGDGWGATTLDGFTCVRVTPALGRFDCTLSPTEQKTVRVVFTATDIHGLSSQRTYLIDTEEHFTYLALGDSFSAGEGIDPYLRDRSGLPGFDNRCHRSSRGYHTLVQPAQFDDSLYKIASNGTGISPVHDGNWPGENKYGSDANVRRADGVTWMNWACSGAVSVNVTDLDQNRDENNDPTYDPDALYDNHPQLEGIARVNGTGDSTSINHNVDLVTMSIGGNDVGFVDVLTSCALTVLCQTVPGNPAHRDTVDEELAVFRSDLRRALREIRRQTFNARLLVVGYPHLFPDSAYEQSCGTLTAFAGEMNTLNLYNDELNETIRDIAVGEFGAEFVDVRDRFDNHEICGSEGAWLNPVHLTADVRNFPPLNDESFHPTLTGQEEGYAVRINEVLNGTPEEPSPNDSVIQQGERIVNDILFWKIRGGNLILNTSWPGSDIVMTLESPSGRTIGRTTSAEDVVHVVGPTFERYEVVDAEPGLWRVELFGADVAAEGEPYTLEAVTRDKDGLTVPLAEALAPFAGISTSATFGPAPLAVDFGGGFSADPDGEIVGYSWDFGDGALGEGVTASHVYSIAGTYTARLTVVDDSGLSATRTVRILVSDPAITVTGSPDSYVVGKGTALSVASPEGVLANDVDGDAGSFASLVAGPSVGRISLTAEGSFTYESGPDFVGDDSFQYRIVSPVGVSEPIDVLISVRDESAVAPLAEVDEATVDEDASVLIDVLANDSDSDGDIDRTTLSIDPGPSAGVALVVGELIRYTPFGDTNGTDSFTYEICDLTELCDTATVTITVTPVNDAPVAVNDTVTATGTTPVSIDVLGNDTDVDSTLTASIIVTQPSKGAAVGLASGAIRYTASAGQCGADSFTYRASDGSLTSDPATVSITIECATVEPPVRPQSLATVNPVRLLETRGVGSTIDGVSQGTGRLGAGQVVEVPIAGRGGVPDGAEAALLNMTVINPGAKGYATLFPCTAEPPNASTLNFLPGVTIANSTTVKLSATGSVCVFTIREADFALDIVGYVPAGSDVGAVTPVRLLETRGVGSTIDGVSQGTGRLGAGQVVEVPIAGRGGVPDGAEAALLNMTVINPGAKGYATLFPCTAEPPNASTLNFLPGVTIANSTTVKLSATGSVCVFTIREADFALDIVGYVPAGSDVGAVTPVRLLETRGVGSTIDGVSQGTGRLGAGQVVEVPIAGRGGVPDGAEAALLNMTVINPGAKGYATLFPCTAEPPNASTLNFLPGVTIANSTTVKLSATGSVCVFTIREADFALDIVGYG